MSDRQDELRITMAGEWNGEGLPDRNDALRLAVESLNAAAAGTYAQAEHRTAYAEMARGWLAVADAVRQPDPREQYPPTATTAICGHGVVAFRAGANWLHPADMSLCPAPPVWGRPLSGPES